jgi:hypothetical protein
MQARKSGDSYILVDYHSRVMHWSPGTGIEVVYQVPAGVADLYDEPYLGQPGYYPGFNTLTVDWPQVGFSHDSLHTYIIWVGFNDADIDSTVHAGLPGFLMGVGYGDIYFTIREGGGWREPFNVTDSPDRDDRYPSLAAWNPDGNAHIMYQTSVIAAAGGSIIGDRDEEPLDLHHIMYYEFPTFPVSVSDMRLPDTPESPIKLRVAGNPSMDDVKFMVTLGSAGKVRMSIFDLTGRKVAELTERAYEQGTHSITWNGEAADGSRVSSGVYFAKASVDGVPGASQRVTLVR